MNREFASDAELHQAIIKLRLRKIGNESFFDDSTGMTHSLIQLSLNPTPQERGTAFEDLKEYVIATRQQQKA